MPRTSLFAREGITADSLATLISKTVLNPALILPLVLFTRYTNQGRAFALDHPKATHRLLVALAIGVITRASALLGRASINNFTRSRFDWPNELVVVTGGSDGIGALVVQSLASRNIKVVILDIQPPTFSLPPTAHHYHCDLTSDAAIHAAAAAIQRDHGRAPTILINNAGITRGKSILSTTPADLRLTFAVNTLSHYSLAHAFLPAMAAANHGMIVTVASLASHVTAPCMVDYSASKAAAMVFHEGLAAELPTLLAAPAVRTVLVCPGYTRTSLFAGFEDRDKFFGYSLHPATVADGIVDAVLRGESGEVMLPRVAAEVATRMRGLPLWFQTFLRKDSAKFMKGFKGRFVEQPSEKEGAEVDGHQLL